MKPKYGILYSIGLSLIMLLMAACNRSAHAASGAMALPVVEVVTVKQKDVPIYGEWIGTLDGLVNADVRAQVTGYLLKQTYIEGSLVRKGQLLFQIDARPFQAALDQAKAQLAAAEAQLANAEAVQRQAQLNEDKYTPLAKDQAATQQDADNAVQTNIAAKATVLNAKQAIAAANAAVESAQINLEFTRLESPIDGIAGQAQLQVGALVTVTTGPVTTVSTLDPIKVFFTVSEQEYLAFNREYSKGNAREPQFDHTPLELILSDGTTYAQNGKFYFADRAVNQSTGAIRMAGLFPNPGNILRPGQYARVRAATRIERGALLVPQRAVSELQGTYQVAVVDKQNKVNIQTITVGPRVGSMWVIEEGLQPGECVIAEGLQKVAPGVRVNPKPVGLPPADGNGEGN